VVWLEYALVDLALLRNGGPCALLGPDGREGPCALVQYQQSSTTNGANHVKYVLRTAAARSRVLLSIFLDSGDKSAAQDSRRQMAIFLDCLRSVRQLWLSRISMTSHRVTKECAAGRTQRF
jgi:hypothetical protein